MIEKKKQVYSLPFIIFFGISKMTDNVITFDETDGCKVKKEAGYTFTLVEKNWKWNVQPLKDLFQKWYYTAFSLFISHRINNP